MIRILVVGSTGRMGQEILKLVSEDPQWGLAGTVDEKKKISGANPSDIDVVVDFSSVEAFSEVLAFCAKNNKPLVTGTTGISDTQKTQLRATGEKTAILWSSNMSLGVAVMNEMLKALSIIKSYDFRIEETHHTQKKDRPSGTAKTLKENLEKVLDKSVPEILSKRESDVFGIHKIIIKGPEEELLLEHTALNRTVFARGALRAASWIIKQDPGLYSFEDILRNE